MEGGIEGGEGREGGMEGEEGREGGREGGWVGGREGGRETHSQPRVSQLTDRTQLPHQGDWASL